MGRRPFRMIASIGWKALLVSMVLSLSQLVAQQVEVRHSEALVKGFLALRTLDGKLLADGDLNQTSQGDRVTSHLVFHFKESEVSSVGFGKWAPREDLLTFRSS